MSINIHGYTTVAYAYLDLNEFTDPKKLYANLINHYRTGDLINMIKSNNTLHLIAKDKDALVRIINAEFDNPQIISQEKTNG